MQCMFRYGLHFAVLQEVEGITKELYFPGGRPVSMQNLQCVLI